MRLHRSRRRLAPVLVLAVLLAACDSSAPPPAPGPDPAEAAARLAAGLAEGDLGAVDFTGQSPEQVQRSYDAVVEGMGGLSPSVGVAQVVREDGSGAQARVRLAWSWPVAEGTTWDYTSTAALALSGQTWQVDFTRAVLEPSLTGAASLDLSTRGARRGDIRGAGGVPLVTERQVLRIGIDKAQVEPARAAASAAALARAVGIRVAPYVASVAGAGDTAFVEAIVLRTEDVPDDLTRRIGAVDGARSLTDQVPLGPTRGFAAPILGTVGPVTAEMVREDPERYEAGDEAGLSGLEERYDDQLTGTDGVVVTRVGAGGQTRGLFTLEATSGTPLRITLEQGLQGVAESLLAPVEPASALVAIRPSDGAVLAAANGPGAEGLNIATYGRYAPGSTFKIVSSLALLRSGLQPSTTVACTPSLLVDGKTFENYDGYPTGDLGQVPLSTAVASSCNTAFISERDTPGAGGLIEAAASLGLGVDHDLGFPAYFGQVEPAATETEKAAAMIGQGTVLASPLTMAAVIASVQGGSTVVPHLITGPDGPVDGSAPAAGAGGTGAEDVVALGTREADQLRTLLRGVVTGGSGSLLADVPGAPVIAKTGTAEFGTGARPQTHAWMVAAQGDLAVAVFVDVGDSGSRTAGPILEEFLRAAG